jgi:hypothetical protein
VYRRRYDGVAIGGEGGDRVDTTMVSYDRVDGEEGVLGTRVAGGLSGMCGVLPLQGVFDWGGRIWAVVDQGSVYRSVENRQRFFQLFWVGGEFPKCRLAFTSISRMRNRRLGLQEIRSGEVQLPGRPTQGNGQYKL